MEQKAKFIIIGLAGFLLITVFFALQLNSIKGKLEYQLGQLKKENIALGNKLDTAMQESQRYQQKADSLAKEVDAIAAQKDELQKRIDLISKEKEELIDKLREAKESSQAKKEEGPPPPGANDAYWANVLKTNADLELKLSNARDELRNLQIKAEDLERSKKSLELDMNNLNREKQDLQRQADYHQKLSENLTNQLVGERNDKFKLQETFKVVKSENNALRRQLSRLNNRKMELERDVQQMKEDKASLERSFANMENVLKGNVSEICNLKEQLSDMRTSNVTLPRDEQAPIDLPPIVVRPQGDVQAMKEDIAKASASNSSALPLVGRVLSVDRAGNFIVVDLGEDSGLKVGDNLQVTRDDKDVGMVSVVQIRKDIAACDIKRESAPVKIGDIVSK